MKKFASLLLVLWGMSAHAYHLEDHSAITHQAFQELTQCFPKASALLNVEWMVTGDLAEDMDLITKWLFYSHYYNPNKKLDMRRADSSVRVADLAATLRHPAVGSLSITEMSNLGHMIHHFQDATVPAHVIPVNHSMWDGFETYKVSEISSGLTCEQIATFPTNDPLTILKETALATLANIYGVHFDFVSQAAGVTNRLSASGPAFWKESNDNEFGQYGYLGNHFGETSFSVSGIQYKIADETYQNFKRQQMQLAVQATIRGLLWELGDLLKGTQVACVEN